MSQQPGQLTFVAPRRASSARHLADLSMADRRAAVTELGEKAFRADQLSRHYFERLTTDVQAMTDLPAASRDKLSALLPPLLTSVREQTTDRGTTRKTLWRLFDGALVESVLMRYPDRVTMCVSSQAGCGMNCPFCATGQAGLTRNMSTAEIAEQVVAGARALAAGEVPGGPGRVNNVVFMGMGEPLANYKQVIQAVRRLVEPAPHGLGISARGVTVSTVGLVPAIGKLADEGLPVTLALSLHAPRRRAARHAGADQHPVEGGRGARRRLGVRGEDQAAGVHRVRADQGHQRPGVAGRPARQAGQEQTRARQPDPAQPDPPGSKWTASRPEDERAFVRRLELHGVPVTVRDTRGREIDGACGQLAAAE
ncbi:23S rRNA (adenine(2503)-C(2))-methyltransferase RlmN [Nonomuraea ferruginea]